MLYRGGWPWPRPPRAPPRGSLSPLSFGRTDRRSEWLWLSLIRRPSVVRRNIPNSWPSGRFSISCFGICPKSSLYVTRGIKQDAALSRVSGRDAAGLSSRSQHVRVRPRCVVMLSPQSPPNKRAFFDPKPARQILVFWPLAFFEASERARQCAPLNRFDWVSSMFAWHIFEAVSSILEVKEDAVYETGGPLGRDRQAAGLSPLCS